MRAPLCIVAVCILSCNINVHHAFRVLNKRGVKSDSQSTDMLNVRVNLAKLPIGRYNGHKKTPQPRVEFRLANRKFSTDPDFPAHSARARVPVYQSDGSLYLTLYDGKRSLEKFKVLLRTNVFPFPGEWLSFNMTSKKGNGRLIFDVLYEKVDEKTDGQTDKVVNADFQAIDTNATMENSSSPTIFEVCEMLQRRSYDGDHSEWARQDRPDFSFYFLCGTETKMMEVCFFKKGFVEFQLCRMSALSFSLTDTHVESNGDFEIPLGVQRAGGTLAGSSLSGAVSGDGIKDGRLDFRIESSPQSDAQHHVFVSSPRDAPGAPSMETTTTTTIIENCDDCSGDERCGVCRFYVGSKNYMKVKWGQTCDACKDIMEKAEDVGDVIDNYETIDS